MIKYLGGACFLYAVFYLFTRRSFPRFLATKQARWFLLLDFLAITSFLTMGAPVPWERSVMLSYVSFLLLFFITLIVVDSLPRFEWVALSAIASMGLASLYVLREWQKYHDVIVRPGWVTGDSNYFTLSAVLTLPLGLLMSVENRKRWQRIFCLGCVIVTFAATTLGASRGGFLGLAVALFIVVRHSRQRMRNLTLASVFLIPFLLLAPMSPIKRMLEPSRRDEGSVDARIVYWKAGLRMIQANPILGVGLGNYGYELNSYTEDQTYFGVDWAHNTFIQMGAELGLLGLSAFLAMLFYAYRNLGQIARRTAQCGPLLLHQAAVGVQAGLVGFAVASFFVSAQQQKLFWLLVFLSMCLPAFLPAENKMQESSGNVGRRPI